MIATKLKTYLDDNGIKYVLIRHSPAYTAQEVAQAAHIPGVDMAKTTIIKLGSKLVMAVLPSSYHINFQRLANALGHDNAHLASEEEFHERFPDCELGAMPPFGNLYGMDTYVAESLSKEKEIYFNAGNHVELVRMYYVDYERLANPRVISFTDRLDAFPLHR